MKLNRSRLAKEVSDRTGIPLSRSSRVIATIVNSITKSLAAGEAVRLGGFGKFHLKTIPHRTVRHPGTGAPVLVPSRRSVGFKSFQKLKSRVNAGSTPDRAPGGMERRRDTGREPFPPGRAVVRISGIPVCEFPVRDISGKGTSILVPHDSMVLRNLQVGHLIEIYLVCSDGGGQPVVQRSRIAHITHPPEDAPYHGQVIVGLQIIDRL